MGKTPQIPGIARRNRILLWLFFVAGVGMIAASFLSKVNDSHLASVLVAVGGGLVTIVAGALLQPWRPHEKSDSTKQVAHTPIARVGEDANSSSPTAVSVLCDGEPIVGATVLTFSPNKTWKQAHTSRDGNAYLDLHATDQPMTVFVAADLHEAHVERGWVPAEKELTINLAEVPDGGSCVFTSGTGYVPGLSGRLNPILDDLDRKYIYADNIAVDGAVGGSAHNFTPGIAMLMEDAGGNRFQVCVVHIIGRSSLIEYRRM